MHEKLTGGLPCVKEGFEDHLTKRSISLPKGLSEQDLIKLKPSEIDQLIRQAGPVLGYASMIKLATGGCDTPPNIQFHAAKFLIERAKELETEAKSKNEERGGWREISNDELDKIIEQTAEAGQAEQLSKEPAV